MKARLIGQPMTDVKPGDSGIGGLINNIFARMHAGDIQGRIVIDFQNEAR